MAACHVRKAAGGADPGTETGPSFRRCGCSTAVVGLRVVGIPFARRVKEPGDAERLWKSALEPFEGQHFELAHRNGAEKHPLWQ